MEGDASTQRVRFATVSPGAGALVLSPPISVDPPIPVASGEMANRWIYETAAVGDPCPAATLPYQTPDTGPLFGPGAPGQLSRYCVYEAAPGVSSCPLVNGCFGDNPTRDMMVVGPAGISLETVIGDELRKRFLQQMAKPPAVSPSTTGHMPVRLALFDTTPDYGPTMAVQNTGRVDHGFNLANIVNTQPRDGSGIPFVEPFTNLAFQLYTDPSTGQVVTDRVNGGEFGSISFLAAAIYQEVGLWQVDRTRRGLVLNLSLGWDPEWGGNVAARATWPHGIETLYRALEYAKCEGAITIAASGNKLGGPTPDAGPLYPAAWGKDSFDATKCLVEYDISGLPVLYLEDTPLLYAVGGVDAHNAPLFVSRADSQPELVAYGDHGTTLDTTGSLTDAMTGTSVSALVASTAAAAIWANRPDLKSTEVMDALYESAQTVGAVDGFWCFGASCADSRRLDVCSAVSYACDATSAGYAATSPGGVGQPCDRSPTTVTCPGLSPVYNLVPPAAAMNALNAQAADVTITPFPRIHTATECGSRLLTGETPIRPNDPCPDLQFYDGRAEPWTAPQPRTGECPDCFMKVSTGAVNIEWTGGVSTLDSLSISMMDSAGTVKTVTTTNTSAGLTNPIQFFLPTSTVAGTVRAMVTGRISTTSYSAEIAVLP